jgi:hypothetical protein
MIALGIDPDLHCTAWGVVSTAPNLANPIRAVGIVTVDRKLTGTAAVEAMLRQLSIALDEPFCLFNIDTVIIEGQNLSGQGGRKHARPQDIIHLAQVAGAAAGIAQAACPLAFEGVRIPSPEVWKGSVPKGAMQGRLYTRLGVPFTFKGGDGDQYAVPDWGQDVGTFHRFAHGGKASRKINPGDWKHLGDALLLAVWGLEQLGHLPPALAKG